MPYKKFLTVFVLLLFGTLGTQRFLAIKARASSRIVQTATEDFSKGTIDSSLENDTSEGKLKLKQNTDTHEDTKEEDFNEGELSNTQTFIGEDEGFKLDGSASYFSSSYTTPKIANNTVYSAFLDSVHNLLYVNTNSGLSVINTQGTIATDDDTLVMTYSATSNPAIGDNYAYSAFLDSAHNLLYVNNSVGVSVINTQGTVSAADDTLVTTYSTTSNPAIASDWANHAFLDSAHNLLYVSTGIGDGSGGLSVINTQGTVNPDDDTLVTTYSSTSSPAIGTNGESTVNHAFLDSAHNLLYVSTGAGIGGGLSVINTQGTVNPDDDTLVTTYSSTSSPAIVDNQVNHAFLDSAHNLLYVSTGNLLGGLSVINTQGTVNPDDDTLVTTYSSTSSPAIATSQARNAFLDSAHNLLYVSTRNKLSVINTQGTVTTNDDTLVINYSTTSDPAIGNNWVNHSFLDSAHNLLYVSTAGGLSVVATEETESYSSSGTYTSPILDLDHLYNLLSWEEEKNDNNNVSVETRTGHGEDVWSDNFNDNNTANVGNLYSQPNEFENVSEEGGALSLSKTESEAAALWTDDFNDNSIDNISGPLDGNIFNSVFESGNTVSLSDPVANYESSADFSYENTDPAAITARVRYVGTGAANVYADFCSTDDWNCSDDYELVNGEWTDISFNSGNPSNLELYAYWDEDTWNSETDKIEIDYIAATEADPGESYATLNTGEAANHFLSGSDVSLRVRYVGTGATNVTGVFCSDNEETCSENYSFDNGEWKNVYFTAGGPFSVISLHFSWDAGSWDTSSDKIEISSVSIDPAIDWGSWSNECSDNSGCAVENLENKNYIQYRFNLSTSDESSSPSVNSVTLSRSAYETSGTFLSDIIDAGQSVDWETLTYEGNAPSDTVMTFHTRSGNTPTPDASWSVWQAVNSPVASPDARYFQYEAVFTSENEEATPTLSYVNIDYTLLSLSTDNSNNNSNSNDNLSSDLPASTASENQEQQEEQDGQLQSQSSEQQENSQEESHHIPVVINSGNKAKSFSENELVAVRKSSPFIKGNIDLAGGRVEIFQNGKKIARVKINRRGGWKKKINPKAGRIYTYQFKYFDSSGQEQETTPSYRLLLDKKKPIFTKISKTQTKDPGDTINFDAIDNYQVDYYQINFRGQKTISEDAKFTLPNNIPVGTSNLSVSAIDRAGNMTKIKIKIFIH